MNTNKKTLIVEDEMLIATLLRLQLAKNGYEVVIVATSETAISKVNEFVPDYSIMEVLLKNNGNGIETTKIKNNKE